MSLYVAGLILLAFAVNGKTGVVTRSWMSIDNYLLLSDRPYAKQFWMTQMTSDQAEIKALDSRAITELCEG